MQRHVAKTGETPVYGLVIDIISMTKQEEEKRGMKYKKLDGRITKTAVAVISALCADYPRRKRLIECRCRTRTTDEEIENFKKTNAVIDQALLVVDEGLRDYVLIDIAVGHGYESSMASPFLSKDSYYLQKNKAIEEMAKGFYLIF